MTAPDPKANETLSEEFRRLISEYHDAADGDPTKEEAAWNLIADFSVANCEAIFDGLSALSAEAAANAMLREALEVAKAWMVMQQKIMLADEGFSPSVTALECDIHAVNKALAASPSSLTARVMALEAVAVAAQEVDADLGPPLSPDSDRVTMALDGLRKLRSALAALTPSAPADGET